MIFSWGETRVQCRNFSPNYFFDPSIDRFIIDVVFHLNFLFILFINYLLNLVRGIYFAGTASRRVEKGTEECTDCGNLIFFIVCSYRFFFSFLLFFFFFRLSNVRIATAESWEIPGAQECRSISQWSKSKSLVLTSVGSLGGYRSQLLQSHAIRLTWPRRAVCVNTAESCSAAEP